VKKYRLVGVTDDNEKSCLVWAHSSLDAGARWKGDPSFYGIVTLEYIEEISSGERRYHQGKRNNGKATPRQIQQHREAMEGKPPKRSLRQPKVRVEFSF
jgi:hypothetical protein